MTISQVANINVYPIKSTAGIGLSHAWVDDFGLAFDRRFVLSTITGDFITARTEPKLCLIQAHIMPDGLMITAPDMPPLKINVLDLSTHYQKVTVWDNPIHAQYGNKEYDKWFSRYINKPCQLVYFGEESSRQVANSSKQVAFADGYPLLLLSQASLLQLNDWAGQQFSMSQFRPNLVVNNTSAFAEDSWRHIKIGEIEFEVAKPCARCIFTTINPENGELDRHQEPLNTLKAHRQVSDGEVMFGQNLIPLSQGAINVGDTVEVIATKPAPIFIGKKAERPLSSSLNAVVENKNTPNIEINSVNQEALSASNNLNQDSGKESSTESSTEKSTENSASAGESTAPELSFSSWNKTIVGNHHETILTQGEAAGLILPYSCRGGLCGRCKLKLNSGEVEQLATDGLSDLEQQQGYILSCSCIPKSDIVVSKP